MPPHGALVGGGIRQKAQAKRRGINNYSGDHCTPPCLPSHVWPLELKLIKVKNSVSLPHFKASMATYSLVATVLDPPIRECFQKVLLVGRSYSISHGPGATLNAFHITTQKV